MQFASFTVVLMRKEFVEAKIGKKLMLDAGCWMLQDTGY
jgi:hypothetical protein